MNTMRNEVRFIYKFIVYGNTLLTVNDLIQHDFAEELRTMEVGFGQWYRLPAQEMRFLRLVGALVEVATQGLRKDRRLVAEDKLERNLQFYLPFMYAVFLLNHFARVRACTLYERHLFRQKLLHIFCSAKAA